MTDLEILKRGAEEALPEGALEKQLAKGEPLRVKLGIDPTAPDIHLGHVVVLTKLAQFQQQGHQVVLIIGDYTARVGDPSGRDTQRPILTPEEIDANAKTFQDQAFKVLDRDATEVRFNSEWLDMPAQELFQLMAKVTVARLLEREDFTKRMKAEQPISSLELLYPILQGYDSVAVRSDVELGGTDQKFNLLFARDIQRAYDVPEQSIMTMPILPGHRRRQAHEQVARQLRRGHRAARGDVREADADPGRGDGHLLRAAAGEDRAGRGADGGQASAGAADRRAIPRSRPPRRPPRRGSTPCIVDHGIPDDIPELSLADADGVANGGDVHLPALIAGVFGISSSEARRLIAQGGVKLDGESVSAGQPGSAGWASSAGACSRSGSDVSSA